jgi:hypothetical protein
MSVELITEPIQLACYWASEAGSTTPYHKKAIRCWSPNDPTGADFEAARQTDAMGRLDTEAHGVSLEARPGSPGCRADTGSARPTYRTWK